jgi:hypothetical protein
VNILIAADMEGIAGIEECGDCLPAHPGAYARGRRLMTDEVLATIAALRKGGAERISVGDWHMVGTNIERERMPAGVEVRPIADLALVEADPSMTKANGGPLDAVVMIGHHASTPNPRAFCSHTFVWEMEVLLDGESLSEVQVYAPGPRRRGDPGAGRRRRPLDARGAGRGRARQRPPGDDQGGSRQGTRPLARGGFGAGRAGRLDRGGARRTAQSSPRAELPSRAANRGRGRGSGEDDGVGAGGPARRDRDRLPLQPGLARVPPARQALPLRTRLAGTSDPAAPGQRRGDPDDALEGAPLAGYVPPRA